MARKKAPQPEYWLINRHTRKCYGPYDNQREATDERNADAYPADWAVAKSIKVKP